MTNEEVYDKFFIDEEYDLDNATAETYSYRSGWNDALKRASIRVRNEIRPQGEWINREAVSNTIFPFWERYECNKCHKHNGYSNFCPNCGAKMERSEEE